MYPGSPIGAGSSSRGAVEAIQSRLKTLGVDRDLDVDGDFGPDTEAAVKLFQARGMAADGSALTIDGVVGPMTWAALFGEAPALAQKADDTVVAAAMAVAETQVGVMEAPLGSNRGPQVDEYLKRAGLNPAAGSYAWCAAFIYWCFDEAAQGANEANPAPKTAGVHDMWNKAGKAGWRRYTPAQAKARPQLVKPGQLFFLDSGGGKGHVGLIVEVEGVRLTTIEGNTTEISGSREGIGVYRRKARTIAGVNLGFCDLAEKI